MLKGKLIRRHEPDSTSLPRPPDYSPPTPTEDDLGVYTVFPGDESLISSRSVELIMRLRTSNAPLRMRAFAGEIIGMMILIVMTLGLAIPFYMYYMAYRRTMRVYILRGQVGLEYGVFTRKIKYVELYRITHITHEQGVVEKILGEGTLKFYEEETKLVLQITGLAAWDDLRTLRNDLLSLANTLRMHPAVKGIISKI